MIVHRTTVTCDFCAADITHGVRGIALVVSVGSGMDRVQVQLDACRQCERQTLGAVLEAAHRVAGRELPPASGGGGEG